jgi:beta-lactamase regulating signal transducer with metallopeptidase domain
MILVLLTRESARRYFGARVAYGLWLIPAARLLMPTFTRTVERPAAVETPAMLAITSAHDSSRFALFGSWQTLVIALWISGALAMFLVRLVQFARQRSAILRASRQIDRVGSIRIITTAAVRGPISFGLFNRVIALPADYETRFNERERALALKHELAHHRSGDLFANFIAFILLCLHWFNPLAWAAHAAFRFDQEAACDARVLSQAAHHRGDYGRAIAKAASGRGFLFAGALDRQSTLQKRLECMLSSPSALQSFVGRLAVVTALAAALPLTANRAITYVDVPAGRESSGLDSSSPLVPNPHSGALTTPAAPGVWAQPEQTSAGRDPSSGAAYTQAEPEAISYEADAARAQRDEADARADVQHALRDEAQRRSDIEQAQADEQQALLDANRSLEESEPPPNSRPNPVEHIRE